MQVSNFAEIIRKHRLLFSGSLFTVFSFFNTGISFLITIILARYLQPDSYGQLNLFNTVISLLAIFISLCTPGIIGVNFFQKKRIALNGYVNCVLSITLVVGAVLIILLFCFRDFFEDITGLEELLLLYAILVSIAQVIPTLLLDLWRFEENIKSYGLFSCSSITCNLVLTVLLVGSWHLGWLGRIYAYLLSCLIFFILGTVILYKKGFIKLVVPSVAQYIESLKYGIPLVPHGMSFWFRQGFDRFVIHNVLSDNAVGIYGFAYNFANIIQILGTAFNTAFSVYVYKKLANSNIRSIQQLKRKCRLMAFCVIVLTLCCMFLSGVIIQLLFPRYEESVAYLFPLCIGSMSQCLYLIYTNVIFYYKKTFGLMIITFMSSILHCLLSLFLSKYGLIYTAYISAISNTLIFICTYIYAKRIIYKKFNLSIL